MVDGETAKELNMPVSSSDAIMMVAKVDGELWYRTDEGKVVSGHPIQADAEGVVFGDDENTVRSLRHVSLTEDGVLHSV